MLYIKINSNALQFIDTRQFQRLRYLKQLGTLSYIFHSANHTRFEHSIGVGYLSGNLLLNLDENQTSSIISFQQPSLLNSKTFFVFQSTVVTHCLISSKIVGI